MDSRHPLTPPTRDVVRILSIIFGFYVGIRLLWVAQDTTSTGGRMTQIPEFVRSYEPDISSNSDRTKPVS